jgi:hypothetical protein
MTRLRATRKPARTGKSATKEPAALRRRNGTSGGRKVDRPEAVNHPPHYGGADDPYEAIKVVEAWALNFHLGNVVKYISRAGKKGETLEDLKKARWYLNRAIAKLEEAASNGGGAK